MFFSHQFRPFSKNWSIFSKLFQSSWQNCILPDHRIILGTYLCFDKVFVCFFNDLWKLNGEITVFFRRKTIGSFVDPAYHVSKGLLCREFFPKNFSFFIIGHWATFVCHFDEILSVPMSVLLSVCQLDQFVVKKVSSNFFSP